MTFRSRGPLALPARIGRQTRRLLLAAPLLLGLASAAWTGGAQAQTPASTGSYPDRPIRLIIGFPAGGPLDSHARLMTEALARSLGQQVIVDYKPGAGGSIGAEFVARSAPDGYTLLLANTGTMVINPALYRKLPYDTLRDFVPVARTAQQPLAIVVNPSVPAQTMSEFIALAKARPGQYNYASAGNGGISHLVPEMFKQATGIFLVHLPYRGSAPAFADVLAGHAQMMAESIPQVSQYVKQGKVRALAVTSRQRNPALPDVPTMIEAGIKDFEVVGFYAILAPSATPPAIVARLADAFKGALDSPEVREKMIQQGADPAFLAGPPLTTFMQTELRRWAQAVKASGAQLD